MAVLRVIGGLFTGIFGIIGMVWGLVSLVLAVLFLIPLLGWLNWILIPFAGIGMLFGFVAIASEDTRPLGQAVLTLCGIALGLAFMKLALGGGIL